MLSFGPVTYMDVQKTGCTFISDVLKKTLDLEPLVDVKHARFERSKNADDFVVISRRDPYSQWVSLYNYGCMNLGWIYMRLNDLGLSEQFYTKDKEGLNLFVSELLHSENSHLLGEGYQQTRHLDVGFQSFRYLAMSMAKPSSSYQYFRNHEDLIENYKNLSIVDYVIRTSHLNSDLSHLLTEVIPQYVRKDVSIEEVMAESSLGNESTNFVSVDDLAPSTRALIEIKEELLLTLGSND